MKYSFEKWRVAGTEYIFITISRSQIKLSTYHFNKFDCFTDVEKNELSSMCSMGTITQNNAYEINSIVFLWNQVTVMLRKKGDTNDDRR